MTTAAFGFLPPLDRGVVSVTGADAVPFLDNLATNALDDLPVGAARFAALLTPQGKIIYEFFALRTADGFLLDTPRDTLPDFVKRLTLYKLRAKVNIRDESEAMLVAASTAEPAEKSNLHFADPRDGALGWRLISRDPTQRVLHDAHAEAAYHRQRLARGIPACGIDYAIGDTFPHEANYDRLNGVSFKKGCFVGQEVVARMQNKTIVRKRVVRVDGAAELTKGARVMIDTAEIGRIGTVDGKAALAMLRLDRVAEAVAAGTPLMADGIAITVDAAAMGDYNARVARQAAAPKLS
jgi:tRNA-modifying protein YgfZ